MPSPLATAILALSPTVYLELGDPNGPAASDSSGNGHPGVYNGVPQFGLDGVPGSQGTAVSFFPQSVPAPHNVSVPAGFMDFTSFTAMIYVRVYNAPPPSSPEVIMSSSPNGTTGWYLQRPVAAAEPAFGMRRLAGGDSTVTFGGGLGQLLRQWVQLACVWDNAIGSQSLYINGRLGAQATGIVRGTVSAAAGRIGDLGPLVPDLQPFTSDAAQFAIFPTALSLAQIQTVYAAGATIPTTGNPNSDTTSLLTEILAAVRHTV